MAPTTYNPDSPEEQPVPLPCAPRVELAQNILLQPPLTRRGHGPGLVIFLPGDLSDDSQALSLDPEPIQKWAEEGFAVVGVICDGREDISSALGTAKEALMNLGQVDIKNKFGVIVYANGVLTKVLKEILADTHFPCLISYGGYVSDASIPILSSIPLLCHMSSSGSSAETTPALVTRHVYSTQGDFFALPNSKDYHPGSASVSHTRSLVFLRKHIGGPYFDLEAIWDEHTYFEFSVRSVAKTMGTMVAEPYVNHIPTMMGGMGRANLTAFYRDHFIFSHVKFFRPPVVSLMLIHRNPPDTALEPVSRTVGADRIIDEFIFTLTHDRVVDWLLPGVPPSGKKLFIPMMSVVNVRGDRLYHEHIWWDQATVLKQAGVLPSHLPYHGHELLRLPVAGSEAARLLANETDGKSNEMLKPDWGIKPA